MRGPVSRRTRAERVIRQAASGLAAAVTGRGIVHRDIKPQQRAGRRRRHGQGRRLRHREGPRRREYDDDLGRADRRDEPLPRAGTRARRAPRAAIPTSMHLGFCAVPGAHRASAVPGRRAGLDHVPARGTRAIPPSELRPDVAGDLEALVLWMLAKDPARRPTAAQVAQGIKPPVVLAAGESDTTSVLPVRRTPARPVLAGTAAAIALLASAVLGIALSTRDVEVPATNDLSPGGQFTPLPVIRSTPRPPVVVHTTMFLGPQPPRHDISPRSTAPTRRGNPPNPARTSRRSLSPELSRPARVLGWRGRTRESPARR